MKTKIFTLLLALAASVGTMFASVEINGLYYNLNTENQTAELTSQDSSFPYWSSSITTANIPAYVTYRDTNYSVTSIGDYAFYLCRSLTSVTISNSVTSIGNRAFYDCSGLTSVLIPNSVTSIGESAFSDVPNIVYNGTATGSPWGARSINGYVDGYLVYSDELKTKLLACSSAAQGEINIPNSVTSIGNSAFYDCRSLTSVTFPNSVTSIGNSAFYDCFGLTSVLIPNSVTSIGDYAFYLCRSLTSVTISNSVTSIGVETFKGCSSLTSIEIPSSVTRIRNYAFQNCYGLVSVTIGDNVTSIEREAFSGCESLTSVTIPNNVTSIKYNAFYSVPNILYEGTATGSPWGARSINGYVDGCLIFADASKSSLRACSAIAEGEIIIPNSVTNICDSAFYRCESITSIEFPTTITNVGNNVFDGCTGLNFFEMPQGVTSIGNYAFNNCSGLTSIIIPNSVTSIGNNAFYNCSGLTSVTIPNSVTSIGNWAFCNCASLISIEIPNNVTSIGTLLFGNCNSLKSVEIPNSVTIIKNYAFSGCSNLTDINVPISVTSIGNSAFNNVPNIKYNGTATGSPWGARSVNGYVEGNLVYSDKNRTSLLVCLPSIQGAIEVPNSITNIANSAFNGCNNLTAIYVPCGEIERFQQMISIDREKIKYKSLQFEITIIPSEHGQVLFPMSICDDTILTAIPDYGYHFTQWSDANRDNPRTIALTQDTVFIAEFAINKYSISTESANTEWGATEGDKTALYLDEVEISASANYGYHFTQWSDGNTDNPRTIILTQDTSFTATFAKNTYSITSNATNGTISGNSTAEYMDEVILTATPDYGYHFIQWSDGNLDNPRTFVVTQDTTFTAEFAINQYEVVAIMYDSERGIVNGETGEFDYLTELTYSAVAYDGYHFDHWNVTREDTVRYIWDYTETAPPSSGYDNGLYYGNRVADPNLKGIKINSSGYCYFTKDAAEGILELTFGPRSTGNGSIKVETMEGELIMTTDAVSSLTTISIPLTAEQNNIYIERSSGTELVLQKIQFIGKMNAFVKDDTLSFKVTSDTTIHAFFAKNTYKIIKNAVHGDITGSSSAEYLDEVTLTANPEYGYHFTQWSDGNTDNPRTFVLTQDTTFTADFAVDKSGTCGEDNQLTWTYDDETKTLTISGSGALTSNFTYGVEAPTQMLNLIIGNEVTEIGNRAFYGMSSINHLVIGGSVTTIRGYAFAECKNFDDITCYATIVPTITENTFANVGNKQYIYLYVPEGRQRAYLRDTYWGEFDVQVKNAETVTEPTENVVVTPSENSAEIVWPIVNEAETYEITITKDDQTVCTLTFNAQGQLIGIAFAPARETARQQQAEGFRFTITGLTSNTQYGYSIVAKDASNNSLDTKSGSFTTTGEIPTAIEDVRGNSLQCTKILRNGQIVILRGNKTYTLQGQEVK